MAKIYEAQIQWQSPAGHRFNAQPLEDYISSGLRTLSEGAKVASEGIQKLKDQEAADLMKKAGEEARNYIDNFEDFSGDNYMEVMQSNAMKFWDDAFNSLDDATKRRFEMNNPKAREIFDLKTHEAAVDKTFNHQFTQYKRLVPVMASNIVALGDNNAIKKGLQAEIYRLTEKAGMRSEDAEAVVDALRLAVAEGAVDAAIGEGRLEDAAALNNDLEFTSAFTPDHRAAKNQTIQKLVDAQKQAKAESLSYSKKSEALTNALVDGSVYLYDEMYAAAGMDVAARERVTTEYNKFLNDFLNGDIKAQYNGVPVSKFFPEVKLFTDVPFSVRQAAVKKIVDKTLENNPTDKKIKRELGYRASALAGSIPFDDEGYTDVTKVSPEKMADVATVLEQVTGYYGFDDGVQKQIDKLSNLYVSYIDTAARALEPSAYQNESTLIAKQSGLGWYTQQYMQSGNVSPDAMDALRKGEIAKTQGVKFNMEYRDAMNSAIENFAYWTNNKSLPKTGSYREMLMFEAATFVNMSDADKEVLGLKDVTTEQIVRNYLQKVRFYDSLGILDNVVVDNGSEKNFNIGPKGAYLSNMTMIDRNDVKNTEWYQSMLTSIVNMNKEAKPNEEVLRSYASANRSTAYKDLGDKVKNLNNYHGWSKSAGKPSKDDAAYKVPAAASAKKIKVNKE